jgi:hypothetical protein
MWHLFFRKQKNGYSLLHENEMSDYHSQQTVISLVQKAQQDQQKYFANNRQCIEYIVRIAKELFAPPSDSATEISYHDPKLLELLAHVYQYEEKHFGAKAEMEGLIYWQKIKLACTDLLIGLIAQTYVDIQSCSAKQIKSPTDPLLNPLCFDKDLAVNYWLHLLRKMPGGMLALRNTLKEETDQLLDWHQLWMRALVQHYDHKNKARPAWFTEDKAMQSNFIDTYFYQAQIKFATAIPRYKLG